MQATEMLLGLGSGMALSLGLGLLLARLLWGGLLRAMCVSMSRAQRTAVSPEMPAALATGGRRIWNPNLGRASAR
ncbi:MAG TPA: hypothetical protein VLT85_03845 [Terriglobales bacterium]|nr:hypothetical protein [Terriglobales bacterium]